MILFFIQVLNLVFALYVFINYALLIVFFAFSGKARKESARSYTGGISVLIPSYNEIYTIHETVESVIGCTHNFKLEIIVVDDGAGSETCDLLRGKYPFKIYETRYRSCIKTKKVRCTYHCKIHNTPIYIIDKEHGGKADALNTAINLSHFEYFLCLDADSILSQNALSEMHGSIRTDTLAIGGNVRPYLAKDTRRMPRLLTIVQIYEYARIFNIVRVAFNNLHIVPLISGAMALFHTKTVKKLGGYDVNTKGEDFELTLRMQTYAKNNGGEVQYCRSAVVFTQAPFDLVSIIRQRTRWHQGMIEVFKKYRDLFHTRSTLSILLHSIRLYEQYGFIFEIALIIKCHQYLLTVLSVEILLNIIYTLYAQYLNRQKILINLFCLSIFGVAFHFFNTAIKFFYYFRKKNNSWELCKRRPYETV